MAMRLRVDPTSGVPLGAQIERQIRLAVAAGRPVTVVDLFQFSTVRALAEHLGQAPDEGDAAKPDTAAAEAGQDRAALRRQMMRRARR